MPALIAHRGHISGTPENAIGSLASLPSWVDGVEVDVRVSADGIPVLVHDRTVNRTSDGQGEVAEHTYAELRQLALGQGEHIPSLADYLRATATYPLSDIIVDLKLGDAGSVGPVIDVMRQADVGGRLTLSMRRPEQLHRARELTSGDLGAFGIESRSLPMWRRVLRDTSAVIGFLRHGDDSYEENRPIIRQLQEDGLSVGASVLNRFSTLALAIADGCGAVITDRGGELASWPSVPSPATTGGQASG